MDFAKTFEYFKVFLTYKVPFGLCLFLVIIAFFLFQKLQKARREDYEKVLGHSNRTIELLEKSLIAREDRIKYLESETH